MRWDSGEVSSAKTTDLVRNCRTLLEHYATQARDPLEEDHGLQGLMAHDSHAMLEREWPRRPVRTPAHCNGRKERVGVAPRHARGVGVGEAGRCTRRTARARNVRAIGKNPVGLSTEACRQSW